jgi:hypothetical protein
MPVTVESVVRRLPGVLGLSVAFGVVSVEVLVLGLYLADSAGTVTDPLRLAYPFVWLNAAVLGIAVTVDRSRRARPARGSRRQRLVPALVAVGYLVVLAWVGGVLGAGYELVAGASATGAAGAGATASGVTPGVYVSSALPPGYGPAVVYEGAIVRVVLVPYKVVGYVALAVLVYGTVRDAAASAISGVLGLLSCVSCSWPVLAAIVSGIAGSGSAVAATAYGQSLGLSTVVFVVTVALLTWRPTLG